MASCEYDDFFMGFINNSSIVAQDFSPARVGRSKDLRYKSGNYNTYQATVPNSTPRLAFMAFATALFFVSSRLGSSATISKAA